MGEAGQQQSPVEWGDFPFIRPSVRPSVHSPLWAIQPGLRPSQPGLKSEAWLAGWLGPSSGWLGLRPCWLGLKPGKLGLGPGKLGLRPGWMAQRGTYGRTDTRMYRKSPHSTVLCPLSGLLPKKPYEQFCLSQSHAQSPKRRIQLNPAIKDPPVTEIHL